MVTYSLRGVQVELFKLKRSLALIVALVIPLFPACANVADGIQHGLAVSPLDNPAGLGPWSLLFRYAFKLWTIFALPMIVAILSALLAYTDHQPKAWKMLFTLPFPREAIFLGKWVALAALLLLSNLVFALANLGGGLLLRALHPEYGLDLPIPIGEAFAATLISWLLSLLMVTIHVWISLRWPSFLTSIVVGFVATVSNLFLIGSYLYGRVALSPWAMPVQVYDNWQGSLLVALPLSAFAAWLACRGFVRRDVL
jgi:ABC-2 type transport system permease protein